MSALLEDLVKLCKGSVHVTFNDHTTSYQTILEYLQEIEDRGHEIPSIVKAIMIEKNIIVQVQAYPNTPIGFYSSFHFNLNAAVQEVYSCVLEQRKEEQRPT